MPRYLPRIVAPFAIGSLMASAGCTTAPAAPDKTDGHVSIEGTIVSIDARPWAYDGNAVIRVATDARGQVAVQLPARWNLCNASPVDVGALAVGMRVRAVGAADAEGGMVVCEDQAHRLVAAGKDR